MLVKIIEPLIINTEEYERLFPGGKPGAGEMVKLVGTIRETVEQVLWGMFLEDSRDALHCLTTLYEKKKNIRAEISLESGFYDKHFGRLVPEEREKELNELITRITEELDGISWDLVLK